MIYTIAGIALAFAWFALAASGIAQANWEAKRLEEVDRFDAAGETFAEGWTAALECGDRLLNADSEADAWTNSGAHDATLPMKKRI